MRTELYEGILHSPAVPLLARGWVALIDDGNCGEGCIPVSHTNSAFVAFSDEGEPIGVISFDPYEVWHEVVIRLGYVKPEWRGAGVYRLLFARLVDWARERGFKKIDSSTATSNTVMRAVGRRQGRRETSVSMVFDVPAKEA